MLIDFHTHAFPERIAARTIETLIANTARVSDYPMKNHTEGCDLSFEYSEVDATVKGDIVSVKNPLSGKIVADSIGEIVHEGSVKECDCEILVFNRLYT